MDEVNALEAFLDDVVRPLEAAIHGDERDDDVAAAVRRAAGEAGIYAAHLRGWAGGRDIATTVQLVHVAARTGMVLARHVVGAGVPGAPSTLLRHARPHVRDHHLPRLLGHGGLTCAGGLDGWAPAPTTVVASPAEAAHRLRGEVACEVDGADLALVRTRVETDDADDADDATAADDTGGPGGTGAGTGRVGTSTEDRVHVVPRGQLQPEGGRTVLDDVVVPVDHVLGGSAVQLRAEALAVTSATRGARLLGLALAAWDRATTSTSIGALRHVAVVEAARRQVEALAAACDRDDHDVALAAAAWTAATDAAHALADAAWVATPGDAAVERLAAEVRAARPRGAAVAALASALGGATGSGA